VGGIRFAARRVTLVYNTNTDIAPGIVPGDDHPVRKFIELAAADTALGLAELGINVEKLIDVSAAPDWRQAQALLGVTGKMAKQLMVPGSPLPWPEAEKAPLDWSDTNEFVPPLTSIDISKAVDPNADQAPPEEEL
jgi:hypothetical protein